MVAILLPGVVLPSRTTNQTHKRRDCHALRPEHHVVQGFGLAMTSSILLFGLCYALCPMQHTP
jgi:hypothetical protein